METVITCPCGFEVRAGPGDEGPIVQMLRHREEAHARYVPVENAPRRRRGCPNCHGPITRDRFGAWCNKCNCDPIPPPRPVERELVPVGRPLR